MFVNCLRIAASKPIFDLNVAPLDPPQIAHAQSKSLKAGIRLRVAFDDAKQHADPPRAAWLLCPYRQWPNTCRTSNNFDEISPAHATLPPKADYAARSTHVSISLRSAPKSMGLVKSASAPFSSAFRLVSASP